MFVAGLACLMLGVAFHSVLDFFDRSSRPGSLFTYVDAFLQPNAGQRTCLMESSFCLMSCLRIT